MGKFIDMTGQRFGKLIAKTYFRRDNYILWNCICDCGKERIVNIKNLRGRITKSCGKKECRKKSPLKFDLSGQRFGYLVAETHKNNKWICKCDCGVITNVASHALRFNQTKSCGCKSKELNKQNSVLANNMAAINSIYRSYKYSALKRNIFFNLSKDIFINYINNNCYYCGRLPILTILHLNNNANCDPKEISYNGIDRKDNNIGYIESNCVSCCKICNRAKSNMSYDDFLSWINSFILYRVNNDQK